MPVFDLLPSGWIALVIAGLLIGASKTALPGLATIAVAIFAAVLPAKESTAVMLILLLAGDVLGVWTYRHDADWKSLRSLVLPVAIGLVVGAVVLDHISDTGMRHMIGIILLALTAFTLLLMLNGKRQDRKAERARTRESNNVTIPSSSQKFANSPIAQWAYGLLGSFTTMVANSGGPAMTMYFLASGFDMVRFLGTQAWFFFFVNAAKVPFQATLGLHSAHSLGTDLLLVPTVIIGALFGRWLISRINPAVFNPLVIVLTIGSAAYLLF